MALSANQNYETKGAGAKNIEVANAKVIYTDALVCINHRNHGSSGKRGRLAPFTVSNFKIPLGLGVNGAEATPVTGDSTATPPPRGTAAISTKIVRLPVTGLAGTAADVGLEVWASADGTFTTTRVAKYAWSGVVISEYSSTEAYVLMPSAMESIVHQRSVTRATWSLGTFTGILTSGASYAFSGFKALQHVKVTRLFGQVLSAVGRNTPTIKAWAKIGGAAVSGGTVTWIGSNAKGKYLSGAVLSSSNQYLHEGDILSIVIKNTTGSAAAAGMFNLYAEVQTELGA